MARGTPRPLSDLLPGQRRRLTLAVAAHGLAGVLLILQAWLIAGILNDVVFGTQPVPLSRLLAVLPVLLARAGLLWLATVAAADAAIAIKGQVRQMLRSAVARGPGGADAGSFASLMVEGVEALDPFVSRYLPAMAQAVFLPLAILAAVLPLDWLSALILALTAPMIPVFMILIGRGAERLNLEQWATLARLSAYLLDAVQALPTLRLFGAVPREAAQVAGSAELYRQRTMRVLRVAFLSALVLEFLATVSIAMVALFIGFALLWGEMPYQRGLFILLLAPEFYLPLRSLGAHYHARMEALGAAAQMAPLLDAPAAALRPAAPAVAAGAPRVEVRDLRFGHLADRPPVLDGLSFVLEPGSLTALVGASGAGKSTVMGLLRGHHRPWSGEVRIGGLAPDALPTPPAWIPQQPHLFAGTVADNIRLGVPDAGEEEVRAAARRAHADGFIERLPEGYRTMLGERGAGLSGGEIRRVALARAFLMGSPLVLLDEPSASLDHESEEALVAALDELRRDRTVLVVAHRLTTVRAADRILVLSGGRIPQEGSFAVLSGTDGPFARLAGPRSPLLGALTAAGRA
ncbi:thiol reductant ABC exporter subunit CydD [Azospirillum thermophilum]|uniref:Thiol reductant ABC exporter subunit CydD n=1 Tax=Azospirillum thermophilum TaxID=2202148 RepID=A0A2S2CKE4_9PROT|nr:thiol reductant ABC exporter subunit CydD [Azospirillum thermophilum]AWK84964.1 thiol reductant ABC exporter subunit CydD [Azospirillum thermophilum]